MKRYLRIFSTSVGTVQLVDTDKKGVHSLQRYDGRDWLEYGSVTLLGSMTLLHLGEQLPFNSAKMDRWGIQVIPIEGRTITVDYKDVISPNDWLILTDAENFIVIPVYGQVATYLVG